ncbi:arsenate reductase (glutaredoxin) [Cochlodiniinecator piscidefendens]|uniref:arsenate reductase (glutaredoxin) n=1 Tax=Cochlodiniinecator piscidefendens TaxID=2715756 RepID=UPI001409E31D|nr:arsenate reductase (glutaredoxin) [Cochlodiniinecator piscidefendens]
MITIWHNPRCSKSRQTLALIEEQGITPNIRLYQKDGPSVAEIRTVLSRLDLPVAAIIRSKDSLFTELDLSIDMDEERLINAMVAHPALIERPIVQSDDKAALGRPPENVLTLFK